jgi:hypothetical protein
LVVLVKLGRNRGSELPLPISAAGTRQIRRFAPTFTTGNTLSELPTPISATGNILSEFPLPTSKTGIGVQAKIFSPKTGGIPVKITKFDTNHLRNDAHFQFHTEFRDLVATHDAEALKIKPQFTAYLLLYGREDEALKKIAKSEFTAKIHEADKARDDIYIGMEEMAVAALRHFNPEVRDAAARLKIVFDTYGNVASKSLDEETSAIHNILQELEGKNAPDAAAVGIAQWAAELKARNNAFEALVKERDAEGASKTNVVMKEARRAIDLAFRQLCDIINVYMVLEGESAYEGFARTLNEVIGRYKRKHHHHHNHGLNQNSQDLSQTTQTTL